jgi:hypothetical protein
VNLVLSISIDPCGELLTAADLVRIVPPERLRLGIPAAFERAVGLWAGRMAVEGEAGDCQNDVALHLIALRKLSARFPAAAITIAADPDGGTLTLQAGSFGPDEEEVASLIASATGLELAAEGLHQRLYVSFRIELDAHAHLLDLVVRALPPGWAAPVVDSSASSLAIGFEVGGDAERLADLIGILRLAWRQEASEPEVLIEIEGDDPMVVTVRTWADWVALERRLRKLRDASHAPVHASDSLLWGVALAEHLATRAVLGARQLSWIDADDQILCLADGRLLSLPERTELASPLGQFRRRSDDSLWFRDSSGGVVIPPPAFGTERRLHGVYGCGGLFSDTLGGELAGTRLRLVDARGIVDGPKLARVRAIDVADADRQAYALAEIHGEVALLVIELGRGWSHIEARPWHPEDIPTDVAVIGDAPVVVTATRGLRSYLYLVARYGLTHTRKLTLPCIDPQIVFHDRYALWITGLLSPPGPSRCELLRVDPRAATVTVLTAELPDMSTLEVVGPSRFDPHALPGCLLATPRAVLEATPAGLRTVLELDHGERVTAMAYDTPSAVFVDGPRGPRLVLGSRSMTVPLPSPGHSARFHSNDDAS